jgi:hypothetical protein
MTTNEFCKKHQIMIKYSRTNSNVLMHDNTMTHWKVTLKHDGRQMTLTFSKGSDHKGVPPSAEEALECLKREWVGGGYDFTDWCEELGYETDSLKAIKIYRACDRQSRKLEKFLGDDLLDELMETEE